MRPGVREWLQGITRYQPLPSYKNSKSYEWRLTQQILLKWISECRVPVVLMLIPMHQYIDRTARSDDCRQRFSELAAQSKAVLHDPLPDLWKYSKSERLRFRFEKDVHHPTRAGHRALAESLAATVKVLLKDDSKKGPQL